MAIRVSTKVEEAWYVDPDLLAGDEDDGPRPVKFEIDAEGPLPRDMTVALGEGDLEECGDTLSGEEDVARHYRDVSLRGALLVDDDEGPLAVRPSWTERLTGWVRGWFPGQRFQALPDEQSSSAPPPPPPPLGLASRKPGSPGVVDLSRKVAASVAKVFEPGRVPPILLASVSFFVGVITTLLGVLIALS